VRRVALTLRADAVEDVLDVLLPLLPQGVYERALEDGRAEVAFYGDTPDGPALDALAGPALLARDEEEVRDSAEERRRRVGHAWEIAGRVRVRAPADPPGDDGLEEIVIEPVTGAFGTGAHPTTRMTLELLLQLEPHGGLVDLGCGAGVVAIAAAGLGWEPVFAVDVEARAVEATRRNAERNGVAVHAVQADLCEVPPPPAPALAANMPLYVHEHVARGLEPVTRHVIASGIVDDTAPASLELYVAAGLSERARLSEHGWVALWLTR
jgi:ribosomal protein L11 methyltransferase